jgi:predicted phage terminase large subunit-like protein
VKICEKSRRIGISWADAADSALEAACQTGCDSWYVGYNKEMSEQYISDVAFWASSYQLAASAVEQFVFEDEAKDILAFRVRFASGYKVTALSSRPSNLRSKGKRGDRLRLDEAAFHDDLAALLKAAIAFTMWGGCVAIWSTHNGVNNEFNKLIAKVMAGDLNYSHHKITLTDALNDGLYQRICLVSGQLWTMEGEQDWVRNLYQQYGIGASEELDCVPFEAKAGSIFNRAWFTKIIEPKDVPRGGFEVRFWDRAATAKEFAGKHHYYTAGVKGKRVGNDLYILHAIAEQVGPADGDALVIATAAQDGRACRVREELEGGSSGLRAESQMAKQLIGYNYDSVKPLGDKVKRAVPLASESQRGNVYLVRGEWNDWYIDALHNFDGTPKPKVNDLTDASSGMFAEVMTGKSLLDYSSVL